MSIRSHLVFSTLSAFACLAMLGAEEIVPLRRPRVVPRQYDQVPRVMPLDRLFPVENPDEFTDQTGLRAGRTLERPDVTGDLMQRTFLAGQEEPPSRNERDRDGEDREGRRNWLRPADLLSDDDMPDPEEIRRGRDEPAPELPPDWRNLGEVLTEEAIGPGEARRGEGGGRDREEAQSPPSEPESRLRPTGIALQPVERMVPGTGERSGVEGGAAAQGNRLAPAGGLAPVLSRPAMQLGAPPAAAPPEPLPMEREGLAGPRTPAADNRDRWAPASPGALTRTAVPAPPPPSRPATPPPGMPSMPNSPGFSSALPGAAPMGPALAPGPAPRSPPPGAPEPLSPSRFREDEFRIRPQR